MLSVARGEDSRHSHRKVSSPCYATSLCAPAPQQHGAVARTIVKLGAYLLAAVAARVPSLKLHIPFISTPAQAFVSGVGVPPNQKYQADNLAKLWQEFLSVTELIAKIFGAVSKTKA